METIKKKKLDQYTVKVEPLPAEDGPGFCAKYEELGSTVRGVGPTVKAAVDDLEELTLNVLEDLPLDEFPAPRTAAPWSTFSGRVTLRVPKMLHAQLDRLGDEQGVSLNQLMTQMLQSGATAMLSGCEFGALPVGRSPRELEGVRGLLEGLITQVTDSDFYSYLAPLDVTSTSKPHRKIKEFKPVSECEIVELNIA